MTAELCHIIMYLPYFLRTPSFCYSSIARNSSLGLANLANMAPRAAHDMATRAQVVTLKALGVPNEEIC
jgi:hypothetical protein